MTTQAVLAAYRSSRPLLATLALLNALTVAGAAALVTADGGWRGTWLTTAAGAYALASLIISWLTLRVSGRSIVIHPDWFDYRAPTEFLQARWDQVDTVWATASGVVGRRGLFGRYEYHLQIAGRRVDAGTAVGADAHLGRIVAEHTVPHMTDRAVAHLRSGRAVRFGTLTLQPDALVVRGIPSRCIDLDSVAAHRLAGHRLALEVKGKRRPLQVRLSCVPNAWVLLDLLDRRADWQAGPGRRRPQRPKNARAKNQKLAGRSAIRRVR